ncbi:MAG: DEAD/DEAH box helicase, partial [Alphaproteobacteria bacterium]
MHPSVLQALESLGYEQPTPIQQQAIPVLYEGHDLLGQAQTGTGKTAAFALPFLSLIDLKLAKPQVLVLAPTRELAIQVAEAFQSYAKFLKGFHVLPVYGGQHIGEQLRALKRGVHVIVGTPGRVIDHLNRKTLDFSELGAVVLDEADEMLRMGFIEDVETILEETPDDKQIALFSATMPRDIQRVADRFLQEPEHIKIETRTTTVETIRQRYIQVNAAHKLNALTRVLEVEKIDGAIIFSRTKTGTMELAEKLEARGYSCSALNGDMNQTMREKTVDQLKRGAIDVVCATDVAARGLDVERISHVINYDIPTDTEAYVHRIGRTGRAGRTGEAILFVTPRERHLLRAIERATRQTVEPMRLPSHEDLADKRVADFKALISSTIESEELEYFAEVVDSYSTEHDVEPREIAAALAYLMQKDRPLIPNEPEIPAGKSFDREQKRQQRDRRDDRGRREERGNSDRGNYERGSGERGYGDRDDRREKRRRPPEP